MRRCGQNGIGGQGGRFLELSVRGGGARLAAAGTESQKHGEIDDKEDEGRTYTVHTKLEP